MSERPLNHRQRFSGVKRQIGRVSAGNVESFLNYGTGKVLAAVKEEEGGLYFAAASPDTPVHETGLEYVSVDRLLEGDQVSELRGRFEDASVEEELLDKLYDGYVEERNSVREESVEGLMDSDYLSTS
ncbi:MAG: hypothetical protein ABEJ93_05130 [Candidatus Nanohalobium sp.]